MTSRLREKWDTCYSAASPLDARAAEVLTENRHLLPGRGAALDVAAGLGGNAFVLARQGLDTQAWDLSRVAVALVRGYARETKLPVTAITRDVIAHPPAPESFEVIVVSGFLHRELCPAIAAALRPGGLLFYQTHCRHRCSSGGPSNPAFLLEDGELLQLFHTLSPIVYREERQLGDPFCGFRDRAMLVALRKPRPSEG